MMQHFSKSWKNTMAIDMSIDHGMAIEFRQGHADVVDQSLVIQPLIMTYT